MAKIKVWLWLYIKSFIHLKKENQFYKTTITLTGKKDECLKIHIIKNYKQNINKPI